MIKPCQPAIGKYKVYTCSATISEIAAIGLLVQVICKTKMHCFTKIVSRYSYKLSVTYVHFPALIPTSIVAVLPSLYGKGNG